MIPYQVTEKKEVIRSEKKLKRGNLKLIKKATKNLETGDKKIKANKSDNFRL